MWWRESDMVEHEILRTFFWVPLKIIWRPLRIILTARACLNIFLGKYCCIVFFSFSLYCLYLSPGRIVKSLHKRHSKRRLKFKKSNRFLGILLRFKETPRYFMIYPTFFYPFYIFCQYRVVREWYGSLRLVERQGPGTDEASGWWGREKDFRNVFYFCSEHKRTKGEKAEKDIDTSQSCNQHSTQNIVSNQMQRNTILRSVW